MLITKRQFQNLPRQYKKLIVSGDPDYLVGECDAAQIEFRCAADLCDDSVASVEIATDVDVHAITAATLRVSRQEAKSRTFMPLYAGMGKTNAEKAYCKFFKEKYNGISQEQGRWALSVSVDKQLRTRYGMIFRWPQAKLDHRGEVSFKTEIFNFAIQGMATAEIIPIALVHAWHRLRGMKSVIINTIHDSIVSKVHRSEVDTWKQVVKQSLTTDVFSYLQEVYNYSFTVPLGVGIKVAEHWGKADIEEKWNVFPDGSETYKVE